jgi:hypothetical protein
MERAIWGLPQAGILANKLLRKRLAPHGYYECINTSGLWRHEWRPITFTLVVDDFGVKYVGAQNGVVYLRMECAIWGLPQAGILANKLLRKRLAPHGYYECINTPGLWRHEWRPITFTLVVDDFGVKYVRKEHADHLVASLKTKYKLVED